MENNNTTEKLILEVQKEFNSSYPFLQIEFVKRKSQQIPTERHYPSEKMTTDIAKDLLHSEFGLSDAMTVSELEGLLQLRFGLTAQILRKSGNLWLETSMTDGWTLKQQNDQGREIEASFK